MKPTVIIFDKQDITRIGIESIIKTNLRNYSISFVDTKSALISNLTSNPHSLVILDYTLSDLSSVDILLNISARFNKTHWVLFSEELSISFLKKVNSNNSPFNIVLKTSDLSEIESAILAANRNENYTCSQIQNLLESSDNQLDDIDKLLTNTEKEILKEIAWGKTAKEIALLRNISAYTVITHRKNIYRKLGVNNSQEASRYALRSGILSTSDYSI